MHETEYDYIFCGFGLSACLILDELLESGLTEGKTILILDDQTNAAEKTWCYWEQGKGRYDALLSGSWKKGWFIGANTKRECLQSKLVYKSLNSNALLEYVRANANQHSEILFKDEKITGFLDDGAIVSVSTTVGHYAAKKIFNSIPKRDLNFQNTTVLLQHFEGWFIKSEQFPFNSDEMILMDFSVPQQQATRFMYVLPFSRTEALVEYTLFSPKLIDREAYGNEIRKWLEKSGVTEFEVRKTETGIIPMTVYPFWEANTRNVLNIGTAGGWTKPGTGYTFMKARTLSRKLAANLRKDNADFTKFFKPNRFLWYDHLLIEVLYDNNAIGQSLFTRLFTKTNPANVLRFLTEKTNLFDELRIILTCPKWPFLRAAVLSLTKRSHK